MPAVLAILLLVLVAVSVARAARGTLQQSVAKSSVRAYAHRIVLARWHSEAEWEATKAIIEPESSFNPCASYPGRHDCSYAGSSSCGVPQANPCPQEWRGRLWETRFAQVRWFRDYVARRYGSPSGALAWRQAHGWY